MSEELAPPGTGGPAATGLVELRDWLTYYSECLRYELTMGQKFTALLGQASLFSFTASAAIFTLAEKLQVGFPMNLLLAVPSVLGLFMYRELIERYFLQIRETGSIILRIEERLKLEKDGLLHVLRGPRTVFYGSDWTFAWVRVYLAVLVLLPVAAVVIAALRPVAGA